MAASLSTGLTGLDSLLGGGVPPGTCLVCIGEPMNAMGLMAYHIAAGTPAPRQTAFFSTDASEADVKAGIKGVGGETGRTHVVMLPYKGKMLPPEPKKGMRYIVDSFSNVILSAGFQAAYDWLRKARRLVQINGDNMLIMVTAGIHKDMELALLRQWADGVLDLGFDRQGFGLYPYLKITKMRGVPDVSRLLLVKETDRGLALDSTKRVF